MADIEYLKGLEAVRERAHLVLGAAERNELSHFDYDSSKMSGVADFVAGVITVCPQADPSTIFATNEANAARLRPRSI
jgi:hypothetical protein